MKHALALFLVLLLVACQPQSNKIGNVTVERTPYELVYNDVFTGNFSSKNITVLGVTVGMTEEELQAKLGPPDVKNEFDFGAVKNWEYSAKIGLNQTGVLYHMEQGRVTRITVTKAMDKYLAGNTTVQKTKEQVYSVYGIPERTYDIPRARYFVYNDEGFEAYLNNNGEYQYAFVYPMRKLPSLVHVTQNKTQFEILNAELPKLLTDTTTLCDQGPTFGKNPARNECKPFENSCLIPSSWVEVNICNTANTTQ
jgi:hypothetical protein